MEESAAVTEDSPKAPVVAAPMPPAPPAVDDDDTASTAPAPPPPPRNVPAPQHSSKPSESSKTAPPSLEEANEEIALLLESGKVTMPEVNALQNMMREHVALREKVGKLKSLLGRSAKAQRETKMEFEASQKRLDQALREVERLNQKVERLANRPTHMDLLADFETNFDRALLSVGQAGGQDPSSDAPVAANNSNASAMLPQEPPVVDGMLLQELTESKSRIDRLESLNSALLHRSSQLEHEAKEMQKERDDASQKLVQTQLELRMAHMEAEHAAKAVQERTASLEEMQFEIDLVTKASVDAQVRATRGEQAAKSVLTDRQHMQQLEAQVQALQEWAQASAEAKRLSNERNEILERQLKIFSHAEERKGVKGERSLFRKVNSLVIGAGDISTAVMELEGVSLQTFERVVLRWKFDLTPNDMGIEYSMLKGKCDTTDKQRQADYLIKDRHVTGGAGGETDHAFSVQNSCTLLWSNKSSWVRPRTVQYEVEAVAVVDD